jgi:ribonucleotide reductase alpha subunit
MFNISNTDVIELAAIRQKFLCMGQSVSLAYKKLSSAFEHVNNIIRAEELGLKTIYYSHTQKADIDEEEEICEACGS